jgi:hypothetical protein
LTGGDGQPEPHFANAPNLQAHLADAEITLALAPPGERSMLTFTLPGFQPYTLHAEQVFLQPTAQLNSDDFLLYVSGVRTAL